MPSRLAVLASLVASFRRGDAVGFLHSRGLTRQSEGAWPHAEVSAALSLCTPTSCSDGGVQMWENSATA